MVLLIIIMVILIIIIRMMIIKVGRCVWASTVFILTRDPKSEQNTDGDRYFMELLLTPNIHAGNANYFHM